MCCTYYIQKVILCSNWSQPIPFEWLWFLVRTNTTRYRLYITHSCNNVLIFMRRDGIMSGYGKRRLIHVLFCPNVIYCFAVDIEISFSIITLTTHASVRKVRVMKGATVGNSHLSFLNATVCFVTYPPP